MLEHNYRLKMMYSPDYRGVDTEQALSVSSCHACHAPRSPCRAHAAARSPSLLPHSCPGGSGPALYKLARWVPTAAATPSPAPPLPSPPPPCLQDFRARIRKYEDGYETIMDRTVHYIKLIDMVTGGRGGGWCVCVCGVGVLVCVCEVC